MSDDYEKIIEDRVRDIISDLANEPQIGRIVDRPDALTKTDINIDVREGHVLVYIRGIEKVFNSPGDNRIARLRRAIFKYFQARLKDIRVAPSTTDAMVLSIKQEALGEAAITVLRRDPKTNKIKKAYKCIGGRKNGKKVGDPKSCTTPPNPYKQIAMKKNMRMKSGSINAKKALTRLNNIAYKKALAANKRLAASRKFGHK